MKEIKVQIVRLFRENCPDSFDLIATGNSPEVDVTNITTVLVPFSIKELKSLRERIDNLLSEVV